MSVSKYSTPELKTIGTLIIAVGHWNHTKYVIQKSEHNGAFSKRKHQLLVIYKHFTIK